MIKKNTAIFLISLATVLLFGQAIVPHHHHHLKICFSHCSHNGKEDADDDHCNCMFDHNLLLASSDVKTELRHQSLLPGWNDNHNAVIRIIPYNPVKRNYFFLEYSDPVLSTREANTPSGLRAPPVA